MLRETKIIYAVRLHPIVTKIPLPDGINKFIMVNRWEGMLSMYA